MEVLITNGVKISVETYYHPHYSSDMEGRNCFEYRIRIENLNPFRIQLLSRYWLIEDSNGERKIVEGPGVVGQQPILEQDQEHRYTSHCIFNSGIGRMSGYYIMNNLQNGNHFEVEVPAFTLFAPHVLN